MKCTRSLMTRAWYISALFGTGRLAGIPTTVGSTFSTGVLSKSASRRAISSWIPLVFFASSSRSFRDFFSSFFSCSKSANSSSLVFTSFSSKANCRFSASTSSGFGGSFVSIVSRIILSDSNSLAFSSDAATSSSVAGRRPSKNCTTFWLTSACTRRSTRMSTATTLVSASMSESRLTPSSELDLRLLPIVPSA